MFTNSAGIWNVRPRPDLAILYGASLVMFLSNSEMVPLSGFRAPVSRLNSVLLPLPLGPMMPTISAFSTPKVTPSTARMPPKER